MASYSDIGDAFLLNQYSEWAEVMAPGLTLRLTRSLFEEWHCGTREPTEVIYDEGEVGGIHGIWARPLSANSDAVMLYCHGGGFTVGSSASHRKLAAHIAKALQCSAFVIDYRLAPEHPFPAQLEDGVAAYKGLLELGYAADSIIAAGDSAGGNLAVSLAVEASRQEMPSPFAVIALSPWTDMEVSGLTMLTNRAADPLVTLEVVEGMVAGFLGEHSSPVDPKANPLYADLSELRHLYICAGSKETLLDNATRLHAHAESCGVDSVLNIAPDQLHVFPMAAGTSPSADREILRIKNWFASKKASAQ